MTDMPDTTLTSDPSHDAPRRARRRRRRLLHAGEPIARHQGARRPDRRALGTRKFEARLVNPSNRRKLS